MLRLRSFFFILFCTINLYSIEVIKTKTKINYNEIISTKELYKIEVTNVKKLCIPVTVDDFNNNKFVATRYLKKDSILCQKDIKLYTKKSVLFNFGSIEIEKSGKIIFENDKYIKIKRDDGKIEKIYKDGRLK